MTPIATQANARPPVSDATPGVLAELPVLLRGEAETLLRWLRAWDGRRTAFHLGLILLGAGLFGAAVGWWRAPRQALYAGIKFPMIILLTTAGNALLNGILAPLLGAHLTFRQSFQAILASFAMAASILGAFSPLVLFLIWNTPAMEPGLAPSFASYDLVLLTLVGMIAFAGLAANLRLGQLLR